MKRFVKVGTIAVAAMIAGGATTTVTASPATGAPTTEELAYRNAQNICTNLAGTFHKEATPGGTYFFCVEPNGTTPRKDQLKNMTYDCLVVASPYTFGNANFTLETGPDEWAFGCRSYF